LSLYPFYWSPGHVFRLDGFPEIWRLFTSFFITGPKLSILFDSYFLFTYMSSLERGSPRFTDPGSVIIFLLFTMGVIMVLATFLFGGFLLLHPLIIALAYIFAQDNPTANVTIFILTFPAKYLPFLLLLMDWLSAADPAGLFLGLPGLLAAHLYDFLTRIWPMFGGGTNYLSTPLFIKRWYLRSQGREERREYGQVVRPAGGVRDDDRWSDNRGPGRRLG